MENIGQEDLMTAVLLERRWRAPGILELRLHRPEGFTFMPGQFLRFLMDGYQRDYTMVSDTHAESIDLCMAMVDGGRFSGEILKADMGTALQVTGPHGHFVFQGVVNPADETDTNLLVERRQEAADGARRGSQHHVVQGAAEAFDLTRAYAPVLPEHVRQVIGIAKRPLPIF